MSGVAALLRQRFPAATARQIRNAIAASGNPAILGDAYTAVDQGGGYVDAVAAASLLAAGQVPDTIPTAGNPNGSVKVNVEKNTDLDVRDGLVHETFTGLRPGERRDILYRVQPNTGQVVIALGGVTPALPPAQQNQLFGDDILLAIHSAKTSAIGAQGDYKVFEFTVGSTHAIANPETGIMRVTVNGDWTNAGAIGASVSIFSITNPIPGFTEQGKLLDGQTLVFPVTVPPGASVAEFRLGWREDWGQFPTNDSRPDRRSSEQHRDPRRSDVEQPGGRLRQQADAGPMARRRDRIHCRHGPGQVRAADRVRRQGRQEMIFLVRTVR